MSGPDEVRLSFEADTRNISLARTVAAAMAARADLPLDQLEDARLAVDEAVSQIIVAAPAGAEVVCIMSAEPGSLSITVSAPGTHEPSRTTFSWTVLNALVDSLDVQLADGRLTFMLLIERADVDA
jgi:serine/threonine-protein kinase RsbW